MTTGSGVQLASPGQEFGVIEVMTAVAGEIEADEAVDHVERTGAQVDVVVRVRRRLNSASTREISGEGTRASLV